VTGIPGSYNRALEGIRLLADRGLPLTIKTMAITLNVHELRAMKQFVENELGLTFKFDAMINPRLDGASGPLAVRLKPEEIVALDLHYPERVSEWQQFCNRLHGPVKGPGGVDPLFDCAAGFQTFAVDPYGGLSACLTWPGETYDLRRGSFQEGWNAYLQTVVDQKATRRTKCRACRLKSMCGMCPVNARMECGDPETPVDFLCRVAHLRAYCMNIPVPPHGDCKYCEGGEGYEEMMRIKTELLEGSTPDPSAD
jgi:radical SAM protein with 4Fe4S-binding SPASM domain